MINKILQDTLVNHFLQCSIGPLLKIPLNKVSCNDVQKEIINRISHKKPKYLFLIREYEKTLSQFHLLDQYKQILQDNIISSNGTNDTKVSMNLAQLKKQIVSAILLARIEVKENLGEEISSLHDMWNMVFPLSPLPSRKFSQKRHQYFKFEKVNFNQRPINESNQESEALCSNKLIKEEDESLKDENEKQEPNVNSQKVLISQTNQLDTEDINLLSCSFESCANAKVLFEQEARLIEEQESNVPQCQSDYYLEINQYFQNF